MRIAQDFSLCRVVGLRHFGASGWGSRTIASAKAGRWIASGRIPETVLRLNEPLRIYLQQRLNLPVELVVGETYSATGEALRFGRIDIAYLGPITYLLRSRSAKLEAFARPSHEGVGPFFKALIIVPADSSAKTLADLKDTVIAFGDRASTSGTWVPRYQLLEAGLAAGRDYTLRGWAATTMWRGRSREGL